jgi:chromosome segregation ATPase
VSDLSHTRDKLSEVQAVASGKELTIARLQGDADRLREAVRVAEEGAESEVERRRQTETALAQEQGRSEALEGRVEELLDELNVVDQVRKRMQELAEALDARTAQVNTLQIELHASTRKVADLEGEVDMLRRFKAAAASLENENDRLVAHICDLEASIQELQRDADDLRDQVARGADERRVVAETVREYEAELAALSAKIVDKEQVEHRLRQSQLATQARSEELSVERRASAQLQQQLKECESALAENQARRAELQRSLADLTDRHDDLQSKVGKLSMTVESGAHERQRLHKDVEHANATADSRLAEIKRLQATVEELETELAKKARQIADARGLVDESKTRDADQVRHADGLRDQLHQVQAALQAANRDLHAAKADLREAERERATLHAAEDALHRLEEERTQLHRFCAELRDANDALEREIQSLRSSNLRTVELESQVHRTRAILASYEEDSNQTSQRLVEKERELGRARERLAAVSTELRDAEGHVRTLAAQLGEAERAKERLSSLEGQVSGLTVVAEQRAKDLAEAREQLGSLRTQCREVERAALHRGSEAVQTLVKELEAKVASRDALLKEYERELATKQQLVTDLREASDRAESARRQAEAAFSRASVELQQNEQLHKRQLAEAQVRLSGATGESRDATIALKAQLDRSRAELAQLQAEVTQLRAQRTREPSTGRSASAARLLEVELERTKAALDRTNRDVKQRDEEIRIAASNIQTLQQRLRHEAGAAEIRPTSLPPTTAVPSQGAPGSSTIASRWHDRRSEVATIDAERAREYTLAASPSLSESVHL